MSTKDKIIHTSIELFNRHGERAITTNHIASHMGISPGNLYYHFKNKEDIHSLTASQIFNIDIKKVNQDHRRKAKAINFGIIYGISAFGLSQNIGVSRTQAKQIIDEYFQEFPKVKEYMDFSIEKARENEFAETILGRRRYLKDIKYRNGMLRAMAERNAINAPIQGSAADIIKKAMLS